MEENAVESGKKRGRRTNVFSERCLRPEGPDKAKSAFQGRKEAS